MDGNSEFQPVFIEQEAFRLLVQEIAHTGDPDLHTVADDLIGAIMQPGDKHTAKLNSACVLAVADAARWLPTVRMEQVVARAEEAGVDDEALEILRGLLSDSEETEGTEETSDCANCPSCRAIAILLRQIIAHGKISLVDAVHELVEWMASPAPGLELDERGPELDWKCVMTIADAADSYRRSSREELITRANELGFASEEIAALATSLGCGRGLPSES